MDFRGLLFLVVWDINAQDRDGDVRIQLLELEIWSTVTGNSIPDQIFLKLFSSFLNCFFLIIVPFICKLPPFIRKFV